MKHERPPEQPRYSGNGLQCSEHATSPTGSDSTEVFTEAILQKLKNESEVGCLLCALDEWEGEE